jgi:hypothetical protein
MPPKPKLNIPGIQSSISKQPIEPASIIQEIDFLDRKVAIELQQEELKTRRTNNETLVQNKDARRKYAGHIFTLTCVWATLIFIVIFMVGFEC